MLGLLQFAFVDGYHFFGCLILLFVVGFYLSRALNNFIKLTYNVNKFVKFTDEELNEFMKQQAKSVAKTGELIKPGEKANESGSNKV